MAGIALVPAFLESRAQRKRWLSIPSWWHQAKRVLHWTTGGPLLMVLLITLSIIITFLAKSASLPFHTPQLFPSSNQVVWWNEMIHHFIQRKAIPINTLDIIKNTGKVFLAQRGNSFKILWELTGASTHSMSREKRTCQFLTASETPFTLPRSAVAKGNHQGKLNTRSQ
jgi:hypothetical protein